MQSDLAITSDIQYIWPLVFGACEIERLDNFEFTLTAPSITLWGKKETLLAIAAREDRTHDHLGVENACALTARPSATCYLSS